MPDHHEVLIEAHDLERAYHAGDSVVYALRGIDLTIYKGEYISLMGPSGSGKTTFFNMIGALDFPTGGRILIGGRNLKELSPGQLAYLRCVNMGYIFQNYNLIEVLSALENVKLPCKFKGMSDAEATRQSTAVLERVGLGLLLIVTACRPAAVALTDAQRAAIAAEVDSLTNGTPSACLGRRAPLRPVAAAVRRPPRRASLPWAAAGACRDPDYRGGQLAERRACPRDASLG